MPLTKPNQTINFDEYLFIVFVTTQKLLFKSIDKNNHFSKSKLFTLHLTFICWMNQSLLLRNIVLDIEKKKCSITKEYKL